MVENMTAMTLPDGTVLDMFGSGGGQVLAERLSEALSYPVPLLGSVPLDVNLRTGGDEGHARRVGLPELPDRRRDSVHRLEAFALRASRGRVRACRSSFGGASRSRR